MHGHDQAFDGVVKPGRPREVRMAIDSCKKDTTLWQENTISDKLRAIDYMAAGSRRPA
jgi:hypothetical protein